MVDLINFYQGKVTFDDLSELQIDQPLKLQVDSLKEDLLQVEYGKKYVIDVGWYPLSFKINGYFKIQLIEDDNWDEPVILKKTGTLDGLKSSILKVVLKVKELLEDTVDNEQSDGI